MDRAQFMQELEKLLADISETERQDALDFYNSYFDDAGAENEASVLRELGSPEKVAAIIKADLQENSDDYGEYTENGYQDTRVKENGEMPDQYTEITVRGDGQEEEPHDTGSAENRRKSRAQRGYHAEKKQNKAIILVIGAVACIAAGIAMVVSLPSAGILTIGIGFLMMALGLLLLALTVWFTGKILPAILRKFTGFCSNLLNGRKAEKVCNVF